MSEVGEGGLGRLDAVYGLDVVFGGFLVFEDLLDVGCGLVDIALDIHGEAGGFGDSETEVERDAAGNASEADEEAPHVVDGV